MIYTKYLSPFGIIYICAAENALHGLWFEGQKHFMLPEDAIEGTSAVLTDAAKWLDCYFTGETPEWNHPFTPAATNFQQAVREELLKIPYGATTTYAAIARRLGSSARAVGTAVGRNPVSLIVPCHRVVASNGSLTGYAGGLERKEALLKLENYSFFKRF